MQQYDYLIVGAGLYGATFAYFAGKAGKKCLVVEKRSHTGGNLYCDNINGINVHTYGAHIFHTSDKRIWDFVNSLVPFNRYTNSPVADYNGEIFNLPFNMNTFHQMWGVRTPEQAEKILVHQRREAELKLGGREPANLEEQALCLVGKDIFEKLIRDYTEKQWGRSCTELPPFIIKRLPVRLIYDNNYFNDSYQGIPIGGYNPLIEHLLTYATVRTNTDFFNLEDKKWESIAENLVYTGPLDKFFDYKFGHFDWRTVTFKTKIIESPNYQGCAVVNYTSHRQPFTRVIEHKHFEKFGQEVYDIPCTVISEEYSTEYTDGMEPYYPVNNIRNNKLKNSYNEELVRMASTHSGKIIFGGRLAQYAYFDMDKVIAQCMKDLQEVGISTEF